jgi:hypothetical protein
MFVITIFIFSKESDANTPKNTDFGLPPDVVGATLGGLGVTEVAGLESKIPNNIAYGTDECLKRCGIKRPDTQLTSQRQPRNQGNMLPDGFAPPAPPPPPASGSSSSGKWTSTSTYAQPTTYGTTSSTSSSSTSSSAKGTNTPPSTNNNLIAADNNNNTPSSSSSSSSGLSPVVIALLVINGILALGILGCLFLFLKSRQGDKKMVSGGGMMGGGMPGMRPIHSFEKLSKSVLWSSFSFLCASIRNNTYSIRLIGPILMRNLITIHTPHPDRREEDLVFKFMRLMIRSHLSLSSPVH